MQNTDRFTGRVADYERYRLRYPWHVIEVLNALIEPIRTRRKQFEQRPDDVLDVLREGTKRANTIAEETLALAKKAMRQDYFPRKLTLQ